MISTEEVAHRLKAIIDIVFNDAKPSERLDASEDGVFESLWAIVLSIAPMLLVAAAARQATLAMDNAEMSEIIRAPTLFYFAAQIISSGIIWAASLAVLVKIAQQIGAARQIAMVIVSFNWLNLLTYLASCTPALAMLLTRSPPAFAVLLLPVAIFNIFALWRVLRAVLSVNVGATISILSVLLLTEIVLNMIVFSIADMLVS